MLQLCQILISALLYLLLLGLTPSPLEKSIAYVLDPAALVDCPVFAVVLLYSQVTMLMYFKFIPA